MVRRHWHRASRLGRARQLGEVRLALPVAEGIAVVQDQNYSPHKEIELYIVRSLTRDGKLLEITAVANNAKDTHKLFMNVKTDPTLRYPAKLPAWTFGVTACGLDVPVHLLWSASVQPEVV